MEEKIYYFPVGIVANDFQAESFIGKESDSLLNARAIIEEKHLPMRLGLKTTILNNNLSKEASSSVYDTLGRLMKEGIDVFVDTFGSGPTRSMYGVLFDRGLTCCTDYSGNKRFTSIATSDLDQFPPEKNLEKILELEGLVKQNEAILGMGSRNVPIVLSFNKENAYLRRILEGFMNLAIKESAKKGGHEIILPKDYAVANDVVYTKTGDFITGAYLFSAIHPNADTFVNELTKIARVNNFWGFEDEYLMGIMAPRFGKVAVVNLNSETNPYEPVNLDEERKIIIDRQIKLPLSKLKGTLAAEIIRETVLGFERQRLENYYSSEQISEVSGYVLGSL